MERKKPLAELLQYIRILILDDELNIARATQFRLQQSGYPFVMITSDVDVARKELEKTNILLIDHYLNLSGINGIEFTRAAKKKYGDDLDIILYSGSVDKLAQNARLAGATACLEKPLIFDYLLLWIQETARRIWLEKILDGIPDEVSIIDPRDDSFGRLHYVNKTKKNKFELGKPLEYDYCWQRFEKKGDGDRPCPDCISRNAAEVGRTVRNYRSYVTWQGKSGVVDIHAAPIADKVGVVRGIIETCRDRTARQLMEDNLQRIESETDWSRRIDLFLQGFLELGYHRVRFYQRLMHADSIFKGVRQLGMPEDFDITHYQYSADEDMPTNILLRERYPTLFLIYKSRGFKWQQASHYRHVYKVDDSYVPDNRVLSKVKWIEVPVIANNKIIAKISIEPAQPDTFISNYELEILNHYAGWAGQALENAQQREKFRLKDATNQLIIQMNRKISRMPLRPQWATLAVKGVCEVLDTSSCSIFLLDGEGDNARLVRKTTFLRNIKGQQIRRISLDEKYKFGQHFVGSVFKSGHSTCTENLQITSEEQRNGGKEVLNLEAYDYYSEQIGEKLQNIMCAVLRRGNKKIGILRTLNKTRPDSFGSRHFTKDDQNAFEALAGQIAIALETDTLIDEIKKSNKLKEFITQEYSHTMKNLMQPVVSISGLLHKDPNDQELWTLLRNEIKKMKTTINTMLYLVGVDDVRLKLNKSEVDVHSMIEDVVKPYLIVAEDKDLIIKTDLQKPNIIIHLDKMLISDALGNLLDNAIKYGTPGTSIKVTSKCRNGMLYISVSDVGQTIAEEDREKVFQRYYKASQVVDKVYQLGLGLTFVKVVTEAHDGSVFVDPTFTTGAKLVMKLPIDNNFTEGV